MKRPDKKGEVLSSAEVDLLIEESTKFADHIEALLKGMQAEGEEAEREE